jgi:hypothetical protein
LAALEFLKLDEVTRVSARDNASSILEIIPSFGIFRRSAQLTSYYRVAWCRFCGAGGAAKQVLITALDNAYSQFNYQTSNHVLSAQPAALKLRPKFCPCKLKCSFFLILWFLRVAY